MSLFFFFNDTATTEIYTLSLHDALPILPVRSRLPEMLAWDEMHDLTYQIVSSKVYSTSIITHRQLDRKSTRLNSSHANISYAVFCLKKNKYTLYTFLHSSQSYTHMFSLL